MKYAVSGDADLYNYLLAHSYRPNEHLEGLHKVPKLGIMSHELHLRHRVGSDCNLKPCTFWLWLGSDSGASVGQTKQTRCPLFSELQ